MNSIDTVVYLISSLIAISAFYIQGQEFIVSMIRGQSPWHKENIQEDGTKQVLLDV